MRNKSGRKLDLFDMTLEARIRPTEKKLYGEYFGSIL